MSNPSLRNTLVPGFHLVRRLTRKEKSETIKSTAVVARKAAAAAHAAKTLALVERIRAAKPGLTLEQTAMEMNLSGSTTFSNLAWNKPRLFAFLRAYEQKPDEQKAP